MRIHGLQITHVLVLIGLGTASTGAVVLAESEPHVAASATASLPDRVVATATLRDGDRRVAAFRRLLANQQFQASPAYDLLMNNPETLQARIGLLGFTQAVGTDVWTALAGILGRELAVGIAPGPDDRAHFIAVSVLRDTAAVTHLLKAVHILTGLEADGEPNPDQSRLIDDVRVFSIDGNVYHCVTGDTLMASDDRNLIEAAIRARRAKQGRLIDSPGYRRAMTSIPHGAAGWAYINVAAIRAMIAEGTPLPTKLPNPLAGLLFGAWWHTIAHGETAVLWGTAENNALVVNGKVDSKTPLPPAGQGFITQSVSADDWTAARLPRFMAELSVSRNWADLFGEREALLTPPAAADLAGFSSVMTTLMGQMDFVDEFLPDVSGPVRLILTRQDFKDAPFVPTPKLPAFALVIPFRTEAMARLSRRLNTVSTQVIAFLNLTAGEEKRPSFLINTDLYRGHLIISAEYPELPTSRPTTDGAPETQTSEGIGTPPIGSPPRVDDIRYNFAPAAAVVGHRYLVATSADLLRNIIDGIVDPSPSEGVTSAAPGTDRLVIRGPEVLGILRDNLPELVANRMLETNQPRKHVQREVEAFLSTLKFVKRLELTSHSTGTRSRATLTLTLRDAPSPRPE